ncbi:MAG: hypothetical protein LBI96_01480, partial [Odoribacteraceae bacterium]|nr:hypothetical protein [Odoribacteraceae bacterium]
EEELLLTTIKEIDKDLYLQISKVQDEIDFYRKFSNYKPLKKFIGLSLLSLQYVLSFAFVISVLSIIAYVVLFSNWYWKIVIVILAALGLFLIDKRMKK